MLLLLQNDCYEIAMESTGKYWIPVFNLFEDFFAVTLANPRYTKTFPGNKTDPRDAKWLSELHRIGLVAPVLFLPRILESYGNLPGIEPSLLKCDPLKKTGVQNSLIVCNIMLSSVATDTFGKSGMAIINALLAHKEMEPTAELLHDLVFGNLRSKIPLLVEALKGKLSETQLALICPSSSPQTTFAPGPVSVLKTIKAPASESLVAQAQATITLNLCSSNVQMLQ